MAFAVRLWQGTAFLSQCAPVFSDEYAGLRAALFEICRGLGVPDTAGEAGV